MSAWPQVLGEFDTMRRLVAGASIARYGDGELKMMYGQGYVREQANTKLATELYNVLRADRKGLLVGIPTLDPKGPKVENWKRHVARFAPLLDPERIYASAFITRPDSSPWIYTQEYLELVRQLWSGKRTVLVAEPTNKLWKVVRERCGYLTSVACLTHGAYGQIDELERACLKADAEIAVLSVGVTATCLAARLHKRGLHAIDFGSSGGFLSRLIAAEAGV